MVLLLEFCIRLEAYYYRLLLNLRWQLYLKKGAVRALFTYLNAK